MRRRPRPDPECWSVLLNPRRFWFWMRYRRTDAAGTRGSAAAAAVAAAVVAVFVLAADRRWLPAAAARTPRRQYCPTTAGWRPGGPPPWPAWPWSWLGSMSKVTNEFECSWRSSTCWSRQCANAVRHKRSDGKTLSGPECHLTSKPRKPLHARRTKHDMSACAEIQAFKADDTRSKEQEPFSVAAEEKAKVIRRLLCWKDEAPEIGPGRVPGGIRLRRGRYRLRVPGTNAAQQIDQ